jgi:hypothetical protein
MSLKVSIKKPCSEKWDNFEKNGHTGFCASCQKNVIDFTTLSDREIAGYLRNNKGNTCGRFRVDQLKEYAVEENRSAFNKVAAILTAGVLILTQVPDAQAQTKEITGRVITEDKEGVPGTNVVVKGTSHGTVTDVDGNFNLSYEGPGEQITLVYSFIGFITEEKTIDLSEASNIGETVLVMDETELLGEIIITSRKWHGIRGIVYGVKSLFTRRY